MKNLLVIIAFSLFLSCNQERGIKLEELPNYSSSFNIEEDTLINIDTLIKIDHRWPSKIRDHNAFKGELFGIARFNIPGMDPGYKRKIRLYLLRVVELGTERNLLISMDSTENIIDLLNYDSKYFRLKAIYQHSSDLGHEGIVVELIEDDSTQDSLKLYEHAYEIFEDGSMKLVYLDEADGEIFKRLGTNCENCGNYFFESETTEVEIEIKEGQYSKGISYQLDLRDTIGCWITYRALEATFSDNIITIDTLIRLKLEEENFILELDLKTNCDVLIKEKVPLSKISPSSLESKAK